LDFNGEKLAQYSGRDGKPAYVAAHGKVYDVSPSRLWKNGLHMNRHQAGADLTDSLAAAPHGSEVLNRLEQKGTLSQLPAPEQPPLPAWMNRLMDAHPFFKRHPHPMVVHFPMAFFITAPIFLFWYYAISPALSLLDAVLYLHTLGTVSLPFAIGTGWISWRANYLGRRNPIITRKIIFSLVLCILDVAVLVHIAPAPNVLSAPQGAQMIYPIFIFACLPIVSLIGEHGGKLVFPLHGKR